MINLDKHRQNMNKFRYKTQKGFSIVELMVAGTIGIILLTGLVTVFETTSLLNKTQNGLARLQENGRFALLHMKKHLEQAGYQYCASTSTVRQPSDRGERQRPWYAYIDNYLPGMPTRGDVTMENDEGTAVVPTPIAPLPYLVDTSYFIHGHECSTGTCEPSFTSLGSDTSFSVPDIGDEDGDLIEGTDVITIRYLSGIGREINQVAPPVSPATTQTITYTPYTIATNPDFPISGSPVLISSCSSNIPVVTTVSSSGSASAVIDLGGNLLEDNLISAKLFSLNDDYSVITYYVANNILADGRNIPTLFSSNNGTVNALIEGVDQFDILYGIKTLSGNTMYLNAEEVDDLPVANCQGNPKIDGGDQIRNVTGCGWRSVVSMEMHLLLNTVNDSSTNEDEGFFYSPIGGDTLLHTDDLTSGIDHHSMHRKEFTYTIAIKTS